MKNLSHPLGINVKYKVFEKGSLIRNIDKTKYDTAVINILVQNPGQAPQHLRFPFRSFVSNFARVMNYAFMAIDNSTSGSAIDKVIKTTTGGVTYPAAAIHTMAVNEGELTSPTQSNYGIWIGDKANYSGLGLTVEAGIQGSLDYNNYMLRTVILADGGSPDTDVVYKATNVLLANADQSLIVKRRFANNGSGNIYIDEIGMVGKSGTDYFLLSRDTDLGINSTTNQRFTLASGGVCEVSIEFPITSASGWTKNMLRWLSSEFVGGNAISQVRDIFGTVYTIDFTSARTQKAVNASADDSTYGLVLGGSLVDGGLPVMTPDSYRLNQKISHGTANENLSHGAMVPVALEQADGKTTFGIQRDFERLANLDPIYIRTSGLYVRQGAGSYLHFLFAWDYLGSITEGLALSAGQVLRTIYSFECPLEDWENV